MFILNMLSKVNFCMGILEPKNTKYIQIVSGSVSLMSISKYDPTVSLFIKFAYKNLIYSAHS